MSEGKLPAFQFYPNDWKSDLGIRVCSLEARGLWIEMMCLMHCGSPYGHLTINGNPISDKDIWKMVGGTPGETRRAVAELEKHNVFSRDSKGIIYCRRMVRDAATREMNRKAGATGGNPALTSLYNKPGYLYAIRRESDHAVKIGIAINPTNRLYKLRQNFKRDELSILKCWYVPNMGITEQQAHRLFDAKRITGEWFKLDDSDISTLGFTLMGQTKGTTPPSSSSSSSSSQQTPLPPPSGGSLATPQTMETTAPPKLNPRALGTNPRAMARKTITESPRRKNPGDFSDTDPSNIYNPKRDGSMVEKLKSSLAGSHVR